ncbi:MAG: cupredoxin domain-containing protein [Armatimonadota bacterium]
MKLSLLPITGLVLLAMAPLASAQSSGTSPMPCCAPPSAAAAQKADTAKSDAKTKVQKATVTIDHGYQPSQVVVKAGRPVELTLHRKEASGCGDVVQFPGLGIKKTLKPGETAVVKFTPKKSGSIAFTCGMSMYKGEITVR